MNKPQEDEEEEEGEDLKRLLKKRLLKRVSKEGVRRSSPLNRSGTEFVSILKAQLCVC